MRLQKKYVRRFINKRKERLRGVYMRAKKKYMNHDVGGNRKLFWKEVGKVNGGKGGELQ